MQLAHLDKYTKSIRSFGRSLTLVLYVVIAPVIFAAITADLVQSYLITLILGGVVYYVFFYGTKELKKETPPSVEHVLLPSSFYRLPELSPLNLIPSWRWMSETKAFQVSTESMKCYVTLNKEGVNQIISVNRRGLLMNVTGGDFKDRAWLEVERANIHLQLKKMLELLNEISQQDSKTHREKSVEELRNLIVQQFKSTYPWLVIPTETTTGEK